MSRDCVSVGLKNGQAFSDNKSRPVMSLPRMLAVEISGVFFTSPFEGGAHTTETGLQVCEHPAGKVDGRCTTLKS